MTEDDQKNQIPDTGKRDEDSPGDGRIDAARKTPTPKWSKRELQVEPYFSGSRDPYSDGPECAAATSITFGKVCPNSARGKATPWMFAAGVAKEGESAGCLPEPATLTEKWFQIKMIDR